MIGKNVNSPPRPEVRLGGQVLPLRAALLGETRGSGDVAARELACGGPPACDGPVWGSSATLAKRLSTCIFFLISDFSPSWKPAEKQRSCSY